MAVPLAAPEESGLVETRAQRRRNPKGKKARKAAARLAAVREVQAQLLEAPEAERAAPPRRKGKKQGKGGKVRASASAEAVVATTVADMPPSVPRTSVAEPALLMLKADALLDQCLAAEPALALALALPVRPEPLVLLPSLPAPRVLFLDAMPELIAPDAEPQAVVLTPEAEPLVETPAMPVEPDAVPAPEPATALAALADGPMPLPRAVALVPARRQGLVDVIAFLLRDSGRRLARWSARRHKSRAEHEALRAAEARQINLQRELEALDALRRNRG
jgi:hypothetical protein